MRFKGLDLNLLLALDVLIEERGVSRAARRLNLSQPAMSAALARLRDYFGDPLLIPQGRQMIPTAEARALHLEIGPLLARLEEVFARSTLFEPQSSKRCFSISASDYIVAVLFPVLVPALQRAAPGVQIDIMAPSEQAQIALEHGELDLMITPEDHCVPGHPVVPILEEVHVVAGWAGNDLLRRPITEGDFLAAGHVAVRIGQGNRASFAERHLAERTSARRIEMTVSNFCSVPDLLIGTDRLAVMHRLLARVMAERLPIAWQDLPFDFPVMRQMIQFNSARQADAGIIWLVDRICDACGQIGQRQMPGPLSAAPQCVTSEHNS